ncbi:DUF305 domain-containing protein [Actinoplanes regularis]|nr:DUF305 domain-containing protein [Actinoplanes regularis]
MPLTSLVPELETPAVNVNSRILLAAALTAGLLGASGCGAAGDTAPTVTSPAATTSFGGTDLAWVEINIAMDEELLPLLELTAANSSNPALKELSAQVATFTGEELGTLRQLHDEAGLPSANPHKGMPMPGMVTPALVASAAAQRGTGFDKVLTTALREHLEQGQRLATSERSAGAETRTKELAARILESRTEALEKLEKEF